MEHRHSERPYHCESRKSNGRFLGLVILALGLLWLFKETGWLLQIPGLNAVRSAFSGFLSSFHFHSVHLTWPLILVIAGIVLIAGRRFIGGILILLAILFFFPGLVVLPGILAVFFLPILLIVLGIVLISRIL